MRRLCGREDGDWESKLEREETALEGGEPTGGSLPGAAMATGSVVRDVESKVEKLRRRVGGGGQMR